SRREHQAVEAPEESGQRLAAPGGREDQRRLAARDRGPAEQLRPGWHVERGREPAACCRTKQRERIDRRANGHASSYNLWTGGLMGDAGEGLIDADGRIQERMEELERERKQQRGAKPVRDPEKVQALESLRLARLELERQLTATSHERRRAQITQAIEEIDRRMKETSALLAS